MTLGSSVGVVALTVDTGDHWLVSAMPRQTSEENERVALRLTGQRISCVRYFLLRVTSDVDEQHWDFGAWHQPTMGVELVTEQGDTFSAVWSQYDDWGFGVDLFDGPMAGHLITEAADSWVDVSEHAAWAPLVGLPVTVSFLWDDFGTGKPPCPVVLKLASGAVGRWIIAADWERRNNTLLIQLGADDLMVIFEKGFLQALGLSDPVRGREHARDTAASP